MKKDGKDGKSLELAARLSEFHMPALESMLGPGKQNEEFAARMEKFETDPTWKRASKKLRDEFVAEERRKFDAEWDLRAGEALFAVAMGTRELQEALPAEVEAAMAPPSAAEALAKRWDTTPEEISRDRRDTMLAELLEETRATRLQNQLRTMPPTAVLSMYESALAGQGTPDSDAAVIRHIESTHARNWSGLDVKGDSREVMAAQKLRTAINKARQSRVPDELKERQALIQRANALISRADMQKVIPRRPTAAREKLEGDVRAELAHTGRFPVGSVD